VNLSLRVPLGIALACAAGVMGFGAASARAEVDGAVAVGAGQRGAQSYASVEARLDGSWANLRLGLAARGQWDDGRWRRDDFTTAAGWGAVLRYLEWWQRGGEGAGGGEGYDVALALGALRPAALGQVSDGAQVGVDDRYHTGLRARVRAGKLELRGEIDDVFAPQLLGAEVGWLLPQWRAAAAMALGWSAWGDDLLDGALDRALDGALGLGGDGGASRDGMLPAAPVDSAVELSLARRFVRDGGEGRLGLGVVGEPGEGAHAVAFAELEAEANAWRVSLRADARAGNGTLGAGFGPLYRVDRLEARLAGVAPTQEPSPDEPADPAPPAGDASDDMQAADGRGVSAALALRLERQGLGWFEGSLRARHHRGAIATVHAGAPITEHAQAGAWLALDERRFLLAGEVRAFWRAGSFAAIEVSRLLRDRALDRDAAAPIDAQLDAQIDAAAPRLGWAVIGWVGIGR
jgi:hypothetical protein